MGSEVGRGVASNHAYVGCKLGSVVGLNVGGDVGRQVGNFSGKVG